MINTIKFIQTVFLLLIALPSSAQVLFSDNFDNLIVGNLTADPTGQIPGQGNWYVISTQQTISPGPVNAVIVQPNPNRGNVIAFGNEYDNIVGAGARMSQIDIMPLWDNRTSGNNILLVEFDFYFADNESPPNGNGLTVAVPGAGINFEVMSYSNDKSGNIYLATLYVNEKMYLLADGTQTTTLTRNNTNILYDSWISAQIYADFNTSTTYVYIPALNINHAVAVNPLAFKYVNGISITGSSYYTPSNGTKIDNVQLSAISTLPTYLGTKDVFLQKFNLYPNPATNVVTITNDENLLVQQIAVYDTTGKLISTKNYNNKTEIQLNVEHLASGTYMLHITTHEGTAVKKLVKK